MRPQLTDILSQNTCDAPNTTKFFLLFFSTYTHWKKYLELYMCTQYRVTLLGSDIYQAQTL